MSKEYKQDDYKLMHILHINLIAFVHSEKNTAPVLPCPLYINKTHSYILCTLLIYQESWCDKKYLLSGQETKRKENRKKKKMALSSNTIYNTK